MKILSITAQKPHSTGSGVYLTGLVKGFAALGHEQAVVAGVYEEDEMHFPEGTRVYPVYYKTESLPFPIAGMSDEMPYESTIYSRMTEDMVDAFKRVFLGENKGGGGMLPAGFDSVPSSVSAYSSGAGGISPI